MTKKTKKIVESKNKKKDSKVPYFMAYANRKVYDFRTGNYVNLDDVIEQVKKSDGEFEVSEKSVCNKSELLMRSLLETEKTKRTHKDVSILLRIIKEGGFVEYIEKLEKSLNL
jgi:polyhydroxyalkanoate synthesis regulator protein